ncbi:hypothetical protein [Streptomyces sp. NPDC001970]
MQVAAASCLSECAPARLAHYARRRWLRIEATWPWANAFTTCWQRLTTLPALA